MFPVGRNLGPLRFAGAGLERACHELDDVLREMHPEAFEGPWTEPEDPDAELVALGNEYDRLAAIEDRLNNRCWRIWREGWAEADHPFDPPRTEADVEKWKVAFNKFQDESGHAEASEELAAHDAIMDPIGKKIEAMTPTTLAGVIAKAKFVRMWLPVGCYRDSDHVPIVDAADVDDYGDQMLRQFIEELIALGGPVRSRAEGAS